MAGFWREVVGKRLERSPKWSSVRKAFLKTPGNNVCAVCGKKQSFKLGLQVHHVVPFSVNPDLELEHSNLITLCEKHHLWFGHLGYFQSWNRSVRKDCSAFYAKIVTRPTKRKKKSWNDQFWDMFTPKSK